MTYATDIVTQYRFAIRDLWNRYLWGSEAFRDTTSLRDFAKLLPPLFEALVARRLEPGGEPITAVFGRAYRAVPSLVSGELSSIYVDQGFENRPGQCWNKLEGPFKEADLQLAIIDLFDWNDHAFRDFRYYRTRIDKFNHRPDLVGREALVDVIETDVLWNPAHSA